jgi:predicted CoA-binding protein
MLATAHRGRNTSPHDNRAVDDRRRARDILDAQEGTGPVAILEGDQPAELLRRAHRIALVGASPRPNRPSHGVMRYLLEHGYDVVPINPNAAEVLGIPAYPTLEDATAATGAFDIVDVFRRSELTVEVAAAAVASGARSLWLQLGIVNWEAARIAHDAGLPVVMNRCTQIEHRRISRR